MISESIDLLFPISSLTSVFKIYVAKNFSIYFDFVYRLKTLKLLLVFFCFPTVFLCFWELLSEENMPIYLFISFDFYWKVIKYSRLSILPDDNMANNLLFIRAQWRRIQKSGRRFNGLTNQQNISSNKGFKNAADYDHNL